jgi:hypothetical protein
MLYHVVNDRHRRRRSMVFTSNKHPDAWGSVLHDDDLAQAIVDRVLERGRWLRFDGPSLRTKHLGLDAPAATEAPSSQVVRISGIPKSEFPEPTPPEPMTMIRRRSRSIGVLRPPNDLAFQRRAKPVRCNAMLASTFRDPFDRVPQPFDSNIVQISVEGYRRATGYGLDVSPHVLLGG